MTGWLNIFGGNAVKPAFSQYQAITLSEDITLTWPIESQEGVPYVAAQIDVTPTGPGFYIAMPPATQGSTGVATMINNVGSDDFTLTDNSGNDIAVISQGVVWIISLTDNSTTDGVWEATQFGSVPSAAQAAALAGAGLQSYLTRLRSRLLISTKSANYTLIESDRATGVIWTGTTGTFALDSAATLTAGWWCLVSNAGTGVLTIASSDSINGVASISLPAQSAEQPYSTMIVCDGSTFKTFTGTPVPTPITAGGTGATNAGDALTNLGGTPVGISIFEAPTTAAILSILGISSSLLTEATVSSNQAITAGSASIAYVCTAALTMTLPEAGTLNTNFFIGVYAQGGDVILTPVSADAINAGTAGASLTIPQGQSALILTDAATPSGNWWPFFLPAGGSSSTTTVPWAIAAGTANAITASYTPAYTTLTDGLLLSFRALGANTTVAPTFAPDGLAAHIVTKEGGIQLSLGDIPGQHAECLVRYNLANTRWELLNPAVTEPPWVIATGTADSITATYSPAIPALYDGLLLGFRATAANATTTPDFSPNGLTARTIKKQGGLALEAGDIPGADAECLARYNLGATAWELLNPANPSGASGSGALPGTYSYLRIITDGSLTTSLTANALVVGTTVAGPSVILSSVSVSADFNISGAGGLDSGSIAANTWYYVWVIYNGSATALLLSLSSTAPTLPGGYTYYARFGAVRTNSTPALWYTRQAGNKVTYTTTDLPLISNGSSGNISTPSWTPLSMSSFVPPTAGVASLTARVEGTNGLVMVAPNNSFGSYTNDGDAPPMQFFSGSSTHGSFMGDLLLESSSIYWISQGANNHLFAYGWTDNL